MIKVKNLLLIILDGLGLDDPTESNAFFKAKTPNLDNIFKNNPTSQLSASGLSVGLPDGQMGNSEVGHTNIGAGRVVYQDLTYINKCIEDETFYKNKELIDTFNYVKKRSSTLHLMGLLSDGGVHSHINHLCALLKMAKIQRVDKVYIHIWTDGRDTSPKSAKRYIDELQDFIKYNGIGEIKTVCGRFYSMDRDENWDRIDKAYMAIAYGKGEKFSSPEMILNRSYNMGVTDEFIVPSVCLDYKGISPEDAVICLNFRSDRVRQITHRFINSDLGIKKYCCFSQYDKNFKNVDIIFKPREVRNTLGEYISLLGLSQLRVAETEKYAHVTFFFNGGIEKPYKNESRIIVDSPSVRTYDIKPEMSAYEVTDSVLKKIESKEYNVIIMNLANPDMVGHTGNFDATVRALEVVDECVGKLIKAVKAQGGVAIITADHGNAEKIKDENGIPFTAHTSNPVPLSVIGYPCDLDNGSLCDIAPTILKILDIQKPREMTGHSLIK